MPPPERTKKKGVKIVWFGVSEREPKLKTTLHGDLLLMVDKYICSLWPAKRLDRSSAEFFCGHLWIIWKCHRLKK